VFGEHRQHRHDQGDTGEGGEDDDAALGGALNPMAEAQAQDHRAGGDHDARLQIGLPGEGDQGLLRVAKHVVDRSPAFYAGERFRTARCLAGRRQKVHVGLPSALAAGPPKASDVGREV
jgi:hypothetical protein